MHWSRLVSGVMAPALMVTAALSVAHAQTPAGPEEPSLRLEDLERRALEKNPTVAQEETIARAVSGRQRQVGLYPNPIVGYSAEDITARAPGRGKHFFWVQQSIVTAGKRRIVQRAVAQEAVHAAAEQDMQRQRVLNAVRMGFWEVLGAARMVELRRELAELAREAVDVSEDLYNVGQADRPDVLEVSVEADRAEIELARAENDLARAWEELAAVLGEPDLPYTSLAGDLEAEVPEVDEEAVREQVLKESPELRIARARVEHARASLARARADRVPNFFVRGGAGHNFDRTEAGRQVGAEFFVEIGVPLPIFDRNQHGTFFYHSHGAMQEMLGMLGLFVIHPKTPYTPAVQKDFAIVLQEYAVLPNNTIPNTLSMEFNWLTFNGKVAPATTPMLVKLGERVRLRLVNIGMDHHPIHLHGMQFELTGTEGGRIPAPLWYPQNTVLVGVAQARVVEFTAQYPGDWMLHCHMPHHMMNQMASTVGPLAHAGRGMRTGGGMEEGMGMVRQGHALSDDLGPKFGRGMGMAAEERPVSNAVRPQAAQAPGGAHGAGHGAPPATGAEGQKKRVPGFPQDMFMPMDDAVAKPETYGLAENWSGAMMDMMTLVRVLSPDRYDEIMRRVEAARQAPPKPGQAPAPSPGHRM